MPRTRRQFLKTGLIGGALLSGAFAARQPLQRWGKGTLVSHFPLPEALREVIRATAPVLLAGAIPAATSASALANAVASPERTQAIERAVQSVVQAVSRLSASTQQEVAELFALLTLPATRFALAGLRTPWSEASEAQIRAFLDRWRNSSLDLLKSGYQALHDLMLGSWYADASAWAAIGYPGPPEIPR